MALEIARCTENPIVRPGKWDWRMSNVYNPAVDLLRLLRYGNWPGDCAVGRLGGSRLCIGSDVVEE